MNINIITFTFDERNFCVYGLPGYRDTSERADVTHEIIAEYQACRESIGPTGPDDLIDWKAFAGLSAPKQQSCLRILLALDILSVDRTGCWMVALDRINRGPHIANATCSPEARCGKSLYFKRRGDAMGFATSVLWAELNTGRLKILSREIPKEARP